jgi:hypothetical protein
MHENAFFLSHDKTYSDIKWFYKKYWFPMPITAQKNNIWFGYPKISQDKALSYKAFLNIDPHSCKMLRLTRAYTRPTWVIFDGGISKLVHHYLCHSQFGFHYITWIWTLNIVLSLFNVWKSTLWRMTLWQETATSLYCLSMFLLLSPQALTGWNQAKLIYIYWYSKIGLLMHRLE